MERESSYSVIDLFAGCGGMTQGFVDEGFDPVLAIELDLHAAATYAANFDPDANHTLCRNIVDVPSADIPKADVVIGGPPCQGFSALGLQDEADPRNKLWTEYVRIVCAAEPDFFVIENVDRFKNSGEFERLKHEVDHGDLSDYEITAGVLNAADFGVPQRRKRTIIIGSKHGAPVLPVGRYSADPTLDGELWVTLSEALRDVPFDALPADSLPDDRFFDVFDERVPGPYTMEQLHFGRNPTTLSLKRYALIPPGGGRLDLAAKAPRLLPPCWRNKESGTTDVMGRLEWDKTSVTIRTEFFKPEKGRYLHPEWHETDRQRRVDRAITHREAALIQTFPPDFLWCGNKAAIARQIGNAVPPRLAAAIATSIRAALRGLAQPAHLI